MSAAIGSELREFLNCLWYGVVLFGVYDALRIFRAMFRHAGWAVGLEDLIFWIWAALFLFVHFFQDTYGAVRGYQLVGVGFGGAIWEYGCGRFITKKIIFCIRWLKFRAARCKLLIGMRSWISRKRDTLKAGKTVGERDGREKKTSQSKKNYFSE